MYFKTLVNKRFNLFLNIKRLKMKNVFLFLFAITLTVGVKAKDIKKVTKDYSEQELQKSDHYIDYKKFGKNKYSSTQQFAGDSLAYMTNVQLRHFRTGTTPVAYDPATNLHTIAMNTFNFDTEGVFQGTLMYNLISTDGGESWDSVFVYEDVNGVLAPMLPSVATTNSAKSENVEDVEFVYYAPVVYKDNGAGMVYDQSEGVFVYYSPDFGGLFSNVAVAPDLGGNSNDPQNWNRLDISSLPDDDQIIGTGTLSPTSDASQYGYYGFWSFDFETQINISNNPEEWWTKHFRQVEQTTVSYNAPMIARKGPDGTIYSVVSNIFATDEDTRYVAFSKSTDNGENWSSFEQIPRTAITDFALSYGNYNSFSSPASTAYQGCNDLVIRGVDDFSYITRLYIFNPDDDNLPARYFIVDVRYNDGNWSVSEIAELETFGPPLFNEDESTQTENDPNNEKYDLQLHPASSYSLSLGNNVQVSKTVDGSHLVVYWIDGVPGEFQKFEPYNVYRTTTNQLTGEEEKVFSPIDSLQVFDIFCKVYNIDTDTWEETKNMTQDEHGEYFFHVPEYIKSLDEAFILTYDTNKDINETSPLFGVPGPINELIWRIPPYMRPKTFDSRNPNASKDPALSIKNTLDFNVELRDVYPNPVVNRDIVEIGFTLEKAAMVSLNIYNGVGNKVKTVINNEFTNTAFRNVKISEFNSGTYYYQLTVDGHTFTKKMVVIK
jgi:hypothetical protein